MKSLTQIATGLLLAALVVVPVAKAETAQPAFRFGADLRLREEAFDKLPIIADPPGFTRGGENNYFRVRPRIWSEWDPAQNVTLRARIVNEFRIWETPSSMAGRPQRSTYKFPDEWVFDHLYLDVRNLLGDQLDLRIGRQDLIYDADKPGMSKVVLEGNPKDGSRTIYFNAVKAVWKGIQDTTVDLVGIYNESIDELAINDADRDLTGKTSANNDITESGGGIYIRNKSIARMPYSVYYWYKNESDWTSGPPTAQVHHAESDIHTVGFRIKPQVTEVLTADLEAAIQRGEQGDVDLEAFMVDASLSWKMAPDTSLNPIATVGAYYLTGDDPNTATKNEAWVPIWARYPQFSELYVYCWDAEEAGRWHNLMMPYAQVSFVPLKNHKLTAMLAYLKAPEKNGPGGGDERGWLGVLKDEFTIREKLFFAKDKLTGHLWAEVLEPGDYYKVNDTGYFLRWELMYAF